MNARTLVAFAACLLISGATLADTWTGLFRANVNGEPAELELAGSKAKQAGGGS